MSEELNAETYHFIGLGPNGIVKVADVQADAGIDKDPVLWARATGELEYAFKYQGVTKYARLRSADWVEL